MTSPPTFSISSAIWRALRRHWSEAEIVDAAFVVAIYTAVSRFVDARPDDRWSSVHFEVDRSRLT